LGDLRKLNFGFFTIYGNFAPLDYESPDFMLIDGLILLLFQLFVHKM